MFRKSGAMLFIMPSERQWTIWTPFMNFDIDAFFFDKNKKMTEKVLIKKWKIYRPKKSYKYLIECQEEKLTKQDAIKLLKSV